MAGLRPLHLDAFSRHVSVVAYHYLSFLVVIVVVVIVVVAQLASNTPVRFQTLRVSDGLTQDTKTFHNHSVTR